MPYTSTEQVKEKRTALKKAFPDFKLSVRRVHGSSISVTIKEAPFNMLTNKNGETYEQINQFYIKSHYAETPKIRDILLKIHEIAGAGQRELDYDGDYGSVPTFYVGIAIGEWDQPFQIN